MAYDYTTPQGSGFQYRGIDPNRTQTKIGNILSEEEMGKLIQKGNQFSLAITEMERLKAICTHRFANGTEALVDIGGGAQRCQICGHEFLPVPVMTNKEDIKNQIEGTKDILQTIKLLYLDMPAEAAREYFVLIALLDKVPDLFECACKDFVRHEKFMPYGTYGNRTENILNIFNMITGGPGSENYGGADPGLSPNSAYMYGNPVFGNPAWGAPMSNGMASFYNQNQDRPYNPYDLSQNMAGAYRPENLGYAFDPNAADQTGTAQDPNKDAKVTEVRSTFKA